MGICASIYIQSLIYTTVSIAICSLVLGWIKGSGTHCIVDIVRPRVPYASLSFHMALSNYMALSNLRLQISYDNGSSRRMVYMALRVTTARRPYSVPCLN